METHDNDPRDDGFGPEPPEDAWRQASEQFAVLGSKLRTRYSEMVGEDGPAEEDVRQAFTTIGTAAQSLVDSISESMRDPEVRDQLKEATSTFFSAIGKTLSQLGDELRSDEATSADDERERAPLTMANTLIAIGAALVVIGVLAKLGLMSWFGNLPGDIRIENERTTLFAPITSMIVISVVGTVLINLVGRWLGE